MNLKDLLNARNLTQSDLAEKLGVTQQTISQWVTGRRKAKLETAMKISQVLNAAVVISPDSAEWEFRLMREPMNDDEYDEYAKEI